MKFCQHCGKEIMDEALICPNCGCSASANNQKNPLSTAPAEDDNVSVGLCILSVLIPLFGIIYWPVKHKTAPKKAKACGICGIVSWAVYFLLILAMGM